MPALVLYVAILFAIIVFLVLFTYFGPIGVPRAMAAAFRDRYLGIMDYYWMRSIQLDTEMRTSIRDEMPHV